MTREGLEKELAKYNREKDNLYSRLRDAKSMFWKFQVFSPGVFVCSAVYLNSLNSPIILNLLLSFTATTLYTGACFKICHDVNKENNIIKENIAKQNEIINYLKSQLETNKLELNKEDEESLEDDNSYSLINDINYNRVLSRKKVINKN